MVEFNRKVRTREPGLGKAFQVARTVYTKGQRKNSLRHVWRARNKPVFPEHEGCVPRKKKKKRLGQSE